ncbi:MAG: hypothetical protein WBK77_08920 [Alphaproteobacteria bacterium]
MGLNTTFNIEVLHQHVNMVGEIIDHQGGELKRIMEKAASNILEVKLGEGSDVVDVMELLEMWATPVPFVANE